MGVNGTEGAKEKLLFTMKTMSIFFNDNYIWQKKTMQTRKRIDSYTQHKSQSKHFTYMSNAWKRKFKNQSSATIY